MVARGRAPPPHGRGGNVVLNVAEKPSVARALQQVFGRMPGAQSRGMERREHQIFTHEQVPFPSPHLQGNGQRLPPGTPNSPHTMITTSVRGHLASQDFPPDYGWSKCDPIALFDAPIETQYKPDMQALRQMLQRLAQQAQILILWLDCDREGEAIGDEVLQVCIEANPHLAVYRARFSTVMAPEIERALHTLGRLQENFVHAVQARQELDLRVGAALTRFQTLRLQRKFDGFSEAGVVSYGPCQFPTLGFVVERWARIQTFVPEDYSYLELELTRTDAHPTATANNNNNNNPATQPPPPGRGAGRPICFSWKRGRLYDRTVTMALYESCLEARQAVVVQLTGRPKNKWRPVPLATVELQKRASRYLRIGSETLMTVAEELYQQGYISYPRTETEKFRPEFNHQQLIQQFANQVAGSDIGDYAAKLLTNNNFQLPRAGQHDDQAHPPITPCKAVHPNQFNNGQQRSVYMLIVKHYLACCSRDAIGRETQLTVRVSSEEFTARGLMIVHENWLEIYKPWERWSTGQGELPSLQVGSRITPSRLVMKDGRTQAPPPISEVELISLMDRNGIGTDATIATHISTIQEREYAIKDASLKFLPSPLGIALVEGYNTMGYQLNKPDLRREVEAECNSVAAGRKTKQQIMTPILDKMKQVYITATQEAHKLDEAVARHFSRLGSSNETTQVLQANFSRCGACNNTMALKQERNARGGGNNNGRNGVRRKLVYCSTCQQGWNLPRGQHQPKMMENDNQRPFSCPICNYQVIQILRGEGYEGNGYAVCPKCFTDPPVEHGGARNGGEFRCFSCQHTTCSLAGGTPGSEVEVFSCPFCHPNGGRGRTDNIGKVMLRKNSRGYVLSCNKYVPGRGGGERCPYTIWLPKGVQTVSVPSGDENQNTICQNCTSVGRVVRKVHFLFKPGSVRPGIDRECTVCVLCDTDFRREMEISLPQPGQVMAHRRGNNGGGRGAAGRGGGQRGRGAGAGRGGAAGRGNNGWNNNNDNRNCFNCGQPGHFASNCPNR